MKVVFFSEKSFLENLEDYRQVRRIQFNCDFMYSKYDFDYGREDWNAYPIAKNLDKDDIARSVIFNSVERVNLRDKGTIESVVKWFPVPQGLDLSLISKEEIDFNYMGSFFSRDYRFDEGEKRYEDSNFEFKETFFSNRNDYTMEFLFNWNNKSLNLNVNDRDIKTYDLYALCLFREHVNAEVGLYSSANINISGELNIARMY